MIVGYKCPELARSETARSPALGVTYIDLDEFPQSDDNVTRRHQT